MLFLGQRFDPLTGSGGKPIWPVDWVVIISLAPAPIWPPFALALPAFGFAGEAGERRLRHRAFESAQPHRTLDSPPPDHAPPRTEARSGTGLNDEPCEAFQASYLLDAAEWGTGRCLRQPRWRRTPGESRSPTSPPNSCERHAPRQTYSPAHSEVCITIPSSAIGTQVYRVALSEKVAHDLAQPRASDQGLSGNRSDVLTNE